MRGAAPELRHRASCDRVNPRHPAPVQRPVIGAAAYRHLAHVLETFGGPALADWRRFTAAARFVAAEERAPDPTPLLAELARAHLVVAHPSGRLSVSPCHTVTVTWIDGATFVAPWPPDARIIDGAITTRAAAVADAATSL